MYVLSISVSLLVCYAHDFPCTIELSAEPTNVGLLPRSDAVCSESDAHHSALELRYSFPISHSLTKIVRVQTEIVYMYNV